MTISIAPTLAGMAAYPFVGLEETRRRLLAQGVDVVDFGKGDPNEPTDPIIRQALVDAVPERSPYPLAQGLPELRSAVAGWCRRRFGVSLDPETEIVPTYGSKEAIFSLAQVLVDPHSGPCCVRTASSPTSTLSKETRGGAPRSSGSITRTIPPGPSRRCRSTNGSPSSPSGLTSRSRPTRRTASCGSTKRRRRRCRSRTARV